MRIPELAVVSTGIPGLTLVLMSPSTLAFFDQDNDGISDANDNCTLIANPQQYDSNADDIGNLCDSDLNNDGVVDKTDCGAPDNISEQPSTILRLCHQLVKL